MSSSLFPSCFTCHGSLSCSRSFTERHLEVLRLQPSRRVCKLLSAASPAVVYGAYEHQHEQDDYVNGTRELFHDTNSLAFEMSAYDVAWIAKVTDASKSCSEPQFPGTIQWIVNNQLPDGSWGEEDFETERTRSTLACVIALRKWNRGESCIRNGLKFLDTKLPLMSHKLNDGSAVVMSALLREAEALNLELDYQGGCIQRLHAEHDRFASRLSSDMLAEYTVSFVHILEAFQDGPTWENLLRYQARDGLLFSPALTACAYMQTGNKLCLRYLKKAITSLNKSKDPSCLMEQARLLVELERLGIERYFEKESQQTLSYLFSCWKGPQQLSLEDAALVFHVLRSHGYDISPDTLRQRLESIDENSLSLHTRYELSTAEHFLYYGEDSLKISKNELMDNTKLSPWYCRLPRVDHVVHIKELGVSVPPELITLAKQEFNSTQRIYQKELQQVTKWNKDCKFHHLGSARQKHVLCYFAPAATLFEPEFSMARIVWAKMGVLTTVVDDYFDTHESLDNLRSFCTAVERWDPSVVQEMTEDAKVTFQGLYNTVNDIAKDALALQKRDISHHLQAHWNRLVHAFLLEAEWRLTGRCPSMEDYTSNAVISFALEPIIMSTVFFMGVKVDDETINHPDCTAMYRRVSLIGRLLNDIQGFKRESSMGEFSSITIFMKENPEANLEDAVSATRRVIDETTKELVEDLLRPRAVPKLCKRVFESMLRVLNFFYRDEDGFSSECLVSYVNAVLDVPLQ